LSQVSAVLQEELLGRLLYAAEKDSRKIHFVDDENDLDWRTRLRSCTVKRLEGDDIPRLAIVEKCQVLFAQTCNGLPLVIGDDDIELHQSRVRIGLEFRFGDDAGYFELQCLGVLQGWRTRGSGGVVLLRWFLRPGL
jgi:hypothetical protein